MGNRHIPEALRKTVQAEVIELFKTAADWERAEQAGAATAAVEAAFERRMQAAYDSVARAVDNTRS
jgi:hypothetical protein